MPISRIFETHDDALAAIADLKQAGYWENEIRTMSRTDGPLTDDAVMREGIGRPRARRYADRLNAGATLVLVDAPFGMGRGAMEVLERQRGSETATAESTYEAYSRDPATPLSAALQLPVLLRDPAPLSRWLGLRTRSASQRPKSKTFGLPLLLERAAPLSGWLGLRTLLHNAAPFSSLLGAPVLSGEPAPLSRRMGRQVLWAEPAPLSSRLGWRTLATDPAPLSRWLGLPVLLHDRKRPR